MRLPPLPPPSLSTEQQRLYRDITEVVDTSFGELVARRSDGALIGPFNPWLHFPNSARRRAFNKSLWDFRVLPEVIHQLVILITVANFGARYALDGHEYFARRAGLSDAKISSVAAGERPADLTDAERVAYDMAAALNRGGVPPESTYRAAAGRFGEQGAAEIVFLVGCFSMVAVTLNAFDVPLPGLQEA